MNLTRGQRDLQRVVVVTGIGTISPLGLSTEETWKQALQGKSGIAAITKFDASTYDTRFAGEVRGFNPDLYVPKKDQKKMDEFILYSIACTKMALDQSGLELNEATKDQTGVLIGSGMGGLPIIEEQFTKVLEKGPGRISPFFIPSVITNMASGQVSLTFGLKGPNFSITSACATGAHSIGEAFNMIRFGLTETMIAGGSEATVCRLAIGGFGAMRALSSCNENPEQASRPFDRDRDGFVLSEGCCVFVIESLAHAVKRKANIICEILGYGTSSDAYHMTTPAPEGAGAAMAMRRSLADAQVNADQVSYVNAHATSTPAGDELENAAIKNVFGAHAKKLAVSGTKSMTGHLLGATGALESAFCALALKHQAVPPTINLKNPSEGCDLDYVPNMGRDMKVKVALNNSFGFGGTNASLVFGTL
jgi:3-oxoacyl-[acyl-carrier-protein] synthase II